MSGRLQHAHLVFLSRGTGISQHSTRSNTTLRTPTHDSIYERYQLPGTRYTTSRVSFGGLGPYSWHIGSWDMSMHCDYSTHICHSFHAVPVSVSASHPATQHVVHPRTIASTRDNMYQSAYRTQQHNTSYTHTRYHPREIPDTRHIQVGYILVKLSQVVSYTWRCCSDGVSYPLSRINP